VTDHVSAMTNGDTDPDPAAAGDGSALPSAFSSEAQLRSEVRAGVAQVVAQLAQLEERLRALRRNAGTEELVVETAVAARVAVAALAGVSRSWEAMFDEPCTRWPEIVAAAIAAALRSGAAHLISSQPVPGFELTSPTPPPAPAPADDPQVTRGVAMYWLADHGDKGAIGVAGADLVALVKAARPELGDHSERRLLRAMLDSGAVMGAGLSPPRWAQTVRIAGKTRRLIVVASNLVTAEVLDPASGPAGIVQEPAVTAPTKPVRRRARRRTRDLLDTPIDLDAPPPNGVTEEEWVSTLDRIEELPDTATDEVLNRLAAAGFVFGPALPRDAFMQMNQWIQDLGPGRAERLEGGSVTGSAATRAGGTEPARRVAGWRPGAAKPAMPGPAVLAPDRLMLPGGTTVPVASPADIAEVAALAAAHGARTIMVHAATPDPTGLTEPPAQRCQQTVRADGTAVTVVILAHDTDRYCGPWADAATPEDLFEGLERFRRVVGHPWRSSVGRTGEALMRFCHPPERGGVQLGVAPTLPAPGNDRSLEPAFLWHRPLTDAEQAAGHMHLFDLNGQYLAAWQSVELGLGEPEHLAGPVDVAGWVKQRPSGRRLVAPPGLWRLKELPAEPLDPAVPNPWSNGRGQATWVTTPTLARVFEVDEDLVDVAEAWCWPDQTRYLRPVGERLRDARMALIDDTSPSAQLALAAVKDLYRRGTGRLAMEDRSRTSGWPRPDWRLAIIALARVNLHRTITSKLAAAPFAVLVDGLCFASDVSDPTVFADKIGLPVGPRLGQFSYEGTIALTPAVVHELGDAGSASAVIKVLKAELYGSH
jgi:hypothetical protein